MTADRPVPYRIDQETNRDVVDDVAAAQARLAYLAGRSDLAARGERVALLRVLGRLEEAEREGRAAYDLARRHGTPRQRVAAQIRLAHVVQYQRRWEQADAMLDEALAMARRLDDPLMEAFAHQHAGRNFADQDRYAEAVAAFRKALALREAHGAPADQLQSTRGALRVAEARLREGAPDHGS